MKIRSDISVLQFNGTDCAVVQTGNYYARTDGSFMIDGWVNILTTCSDAAIVDIPGLARVGTTSGGCLQFMAPNNPPVETPLPYNTWFHFLCEYSKDRNVTICINGEKRISKPMYIQTTDFAPMLTIGKDTQGSYFKGYLSMVRIWTTGITADYSRPMHTAYDNTTPGLLAQYPLCDHSADNTGNPGATGAHAYIAGSATWVTLPDTPFYLLLPDRVLSIGENYKSRIKLDNKLVQNDSGFSVEFWLRFEKMDNNQILQIGAPDVYGNRPPCCTISFINTTSFQLDFEMTDNGSIYNKIVSDKSHFDFKWHHWACVYDQAARSVTIYKDGQVAGSKIFVQRVPFGGTTYLFSNTFPNVPFAQCEMGELRFWNKAISNDDITANRYKRIDPATPGLAMYYPFSARGLSSTNSIVNAGGVGIIDTGNQALQYVVPAEGPISFAPLQSCCLLADNGTLTANNPAEGQYPQATLLFWVNRERLNLAETVFYFKDISFGFNADNTAFFTAGDWQVASKPLGADQAWQHWALVYDQTQGQMLMYLHGELISQPDPFRRSWYPGGQCTICIGCDFGNTNYFNGSFSALSIWNRVLSRGEIKGFKNKLIMVNELNLQHYWTMDDLDIGVYFDTRRDMHLQVNGNVTQTPLITKANRNTGERTKLLLGYKSQAAKIVSDAKAKAHTDKVQAHNDAAAKIKTAHDNASRTMSRPSVDMWFVLKYWDAYWRTTLRHTNPTGGIVQDYAIPVDDIQGCTPSIDMVDNKLHWVRPMNERAVASFPYGVSVNYLDNNAHLDVANKSLTFAVRIRFDRPDTENYLLSAGLQTAGSGFYFKYDPTGFIVAGNYGTEVKLNCPKFDDKWHDLMIIYKVADNSYTLMVDSNPYSTVKGTQAFITQNIYTNYYSNIYIANSAGNYSSLFGNIAKAKLYNSELQYPDMQNWYAGTKAGDNLCQIAWIFDVAVGQTAYLKYRLNLAPNDFFTYSLRGSIMNVPKYKLQPARRYPVTFNGNASVIDCGDMKIDTENGFVVEMWARYQVRQSDSCMMFHGDLGGNARTYMGINKAGQFIFTHAGNTITVDKTEFDYNWHHWACIANRNNLIVQLDGREVGRVNWSYQPGVIGRLLIGNSNLNADNNFMEAISYFKISKTIVANLVTNLSDYNNPWSTVYSDQRTLPNTVESYQNNGQFATVIFDFYDMSATDQTFGQVTGKMNNVTRPGDNIAGAVWHYAYKFMENKMVRKLMVTNTERLEQYNSSNSVCAVDVANQQIRFAFEGGPYYIGSVLSNFFYVEQGGLTSSLYDKVGYNKMGYILNSKFVFANPVSYPQPDIAINLNPYNILANAADFKADQGVNLAYSFKTHTVYINQGNKIWTYNYNYGGLAPKPITAPDDAHDIYMRIDEEFLYVLGTNGVLRVLDVITNIWGYLYTIPMPADQVLSITAIDALAQLDDRIAKLTEKKNQQIYLAAQNLATAHSQAAAKYAPYQQQHETATQSSQNTITAGQVKATKMKADAQVKKAAAQVSHDQGIAAANATAATTKQTATDTGNATKAQATSDAATVRQGANNLLTQANQLQQQNQAHG